MNNPYIDVSVLKVAPRVISQRVECQRKTHIVEKTFGLVAQTLPLLNTTMSCEVCAVSPHSLQTAEKEPMDLLTEDRRRISSITVETIAGSTVDVPVFSTTTSLLTTDNSGDKENGEKVFVDISSICSQDNALLRDVETGEVLVPQPQTFRYHVHGVHTDNSRRIARKRKRRIVVLHKLGGRYQVVAVVLKKATVKVSKPEE
ncbi:uncharacterized protein TM35_000093100 [Trypanosoma theileri]|uniref:Uncharacterized protein n=1 Tax=Trypanosoma theileri TaxID=67003 RepID=A0A1X0P1H6_9TRYP|nr:uncharacterized protein TM35_000093100 [Trypanosoma theileri]ORC90260.1 hypothetical protein TM35_000093100 [Trypanosoma theileri]